MASCAGRVQNRSEDARLARRPPQGREALCVGAYVHCSAGARSLVSRLSAVPAPRDESFSRGFVWPDSFADVAEELESGRLPLLSEISGRFSRPLTASSGTDCSVHSG